MKTKNLISLLAAMFLMTSTLQAQVIPGLWEKVVDLEPGTPIIVVLKAGDRMECIFSSIGTDSITFTYEQETERKVPKAEISKILSYEKYKDRVWDDPIIGAAVGTAVGALVGLFISEKNDKDTLKALTLGRTVIGAPIGFAVDMTRKANVVLYKAR